MTPPKPLDIEAVRKVCDAATENFPRRANTGEYYIADQGDADFIALARTALPTALDELADLRKENERLRAETMDDPFQCVDALANTVTETCNQYADAMKRWKAERDQLRAECERLRGAMKTQMYRRTEVVQNDTAEQIATCLEQAKGNYTRGMTSEDYDIETLQGTYYRRAAALIRSMAWRTPGSDSRGGG